MKTAKCSSCQADIIWIVTEMGKKMPVDAKIVLGFILVDEPGVTRGLTEKVHVSHFATCPNADQHRKP